jgi:hypothetical protein
VPIETQPGIDVEVGVRAEDTTGSAAVKTSTLEIRIWDERLDSGDLLEEHENDREFNSISSRRNGSETTGRSVAKSFSG